MKVHFCGKVVRKEGVTAVERKWTEQIRASFPSENNFVYRQLSESLAKTCTR